MTVLINQTRASNLNINTSNLNSISALALACAIAPRSNNSPSNSRSTTPPSLLHHLPPGLAPTSRLNFDLYRSSLEAPPLAPVDRPRVINVPREGTDKLMETNARVEEGKRRIRGQTTIQSSMDFNQKRRESWERSINISERPGVTAVKSSPAKEIVPQHQNNGKEINLSNGSPHQLPYNHNRLNNHIPPSAPLPLPIARTLPSILGILPLTARSANFPPSHTRDSTKRKYSYSFGSPTSMGGESGGAKGVVIVPRNVRMCRRGGITPSSPRSEFARSTIIQNSSLRVPSLPPPHILPPPRLSHSLKIPIIRPSSSAMQKSTPAFNLPPMHLLTADVKLGYGLHATPKPVQKRLVLPSISSLVGEAMEWRRYDSEVMRRRSEAIVMGKVAMMRQSEVAASGVRRASLCDRRGKKVVHLKI